jgi:hypothetical protein
VIKNKSSRALVKIIGGNFPSFLKLFETPEKGIRSGFSAQVVS